MGFSDSTTAELPDIAMVLVLVLRFNCSVQHQGFFKLENTSSLQNNHLNVRLSLKAVVAEKL